MNTYKNLPEFKIGSMYASVLRVRDDADYDLLATFNNSEQLLDDVWFFNMVMTYLGALRDGLDDHEIIITERQDAVDILEIDVQDEEVNNASYNAG